MGEPGANIGEPFRIQPPQIPDGSLQPNGGWMRLSHRGESAVLALEAEYAEVLVAFFGHRHVNLLPIGPEAEQRPASGGQQVRRLLARLHG